MTNISETQHSVSIATNVGNEKDDRVQVGDNGVVVDHGLHRKLKQRHLQMIALGGVVGASIWYGIGVAIASSGPIGTLIAFIVIGVDVFFVMQSLGEMASLYPTPGAFTELAGRFVDPAVSVGLGWNYWYLWAANIAAEYNLAALVLSYWTDKVPQYAWVLIFWTLFQVISLFDVMIYGELEFWLAAWKIMTILATYILSILVNTGGILRGDYIGFRYWVNPGPFANGINGFGQTFVLAAVYHAGTEMVVITGGESRNPRKDLPKAVRQSMFRIIFIYIGMAFFASILVASNDPNLQDGESRGAMSPFAIALKHAGWDGGADLINVFIFTAIFSATNSSVYTGSRTLFALADMGRAPKFLVKTHFSGVPVYAALVTNAVGLVALMNIASGAGKVFGYLVSLAGSAAFIAWACIGITHLRFRKAWRLQGHSADELPFKAWLYPYGTIFATFLNIFLLFVQGYGTLISPWRPVDFVFSYITIVLFLTLVVGWKIYHRTTLIDLKEVDLQYGQRSFLGGQEESEEKPSFIRRCARAVGNQIKR